MRLGAAAADAEPELDAGLAADEELMLRDGDAAAAAAAAAPPFFNFLLGLASALRLEDGGVALLRAAIASASLASIRVCSSSSGSISLHCVLCAGMPGTEAGASSSRPRLPAPPLLASLVGVGGEAAAALRRCRLLLGMRVGTVAAAAGAAS